VTQDQFNALAQLLRVREGTARQAAAMVLVDGHAQADVARLTGLSPAGVGNAVMRFRRGRALALLAVA
jgi:TrfB plasmid transcriptional repressor